MTITIDSDAQAGTGPVQTGQADAGNAAPKGWQAIKPLLCERIRCRLTALKRLANEREDGAGVEETLAIIGDDAVALWRLAEQIDRRLDRAFAPTAGRVPLPDGRGRPDAPACPDEFRSQ